MSSTLSSDLLPDYKPLLAHPLVAQLNQVAQQAGGQAYLVGGAVRDFIFNQSISDDLDFTIVGVPAEIIAKHLAQSIDGRYILLDPDYGIHRVIIFPQQTVDDALESASEEKPVSIDIADALENNIQNDLARRDLTINAMALCLSSQTLLDPFNGVADLKNQTIRLINETNLLDDPLRLLRVFRFAAKFNTHSKATTITADTLACVKKHSKKVLQAAPERITAEWLKLLEASHSFATLEVMGRTGFLEVLFPEFTPLRDIPPNGYHHLMLFDHTLELVKQAERLLPTFCDESKQWIMQPFNGAVSRFGLIKFACLLHDIGKPATKDIKDNGRFTFYGHDKVSADMAKEIAKRLKLSNKTSAYIQKLCRWHLYPCHFGQQSPAKSVLRFFRRIEDDVPDLILLSLADRYSTLSDEVSPRQVETDHKNHLWLLQRYLQEKKVLKLPPLLSGKEIMPLLGLGEGPEIGLWLKKLKEAQELGIVNTKDEAIQWVTAQ